VLQAIDCDRPIADSLPFPRSSRWTQPGQSLSTFVAASERVGARRTGEGVNPDVTPAGQFKAGNGS